MTYRLSAAAEPASRYILQFPCKRSADAGQTGSIGPSNAPRTASFFNDPGTQQKIRSAASSRRRVSVIA